MTRRVIAILALALAMIALGTAEVAAVGTASGPRLICNYISTTGVPVITPCPTTAPNTPTTDTTAKVTVTVPTSGPAPPPPGATVTTPLPAPPNTGRTGD